MTKNDYGSLYGLTNTSRQGKDLWGKNQFNSTFPAALACYMRDHNHGAVYVQLAEDLKTECVVIPIDDVFGTNLPNDKLYFDFEARYEPYDKLVDHTLERVDLVIKKATEIEDKKLGKLVMPGTCLQALEVKLTVIPDNTTCKNPPDKWFPEMVIRPATTMYCAMSIASRVTQDEAKKIFDSVGRDVMAWGNLTEATQLLPKVIEALDKFQDTFRDRQHPLILQPIWRTQGKKPLLDDNAFDIFVWSDYALMRVITDLVKRNPENVSRYARSALRLTRYMFEYCRAGVAHINNIYASMTYNQQSDKEFALNGKITQQYMNHPRMQAPILGKEAVRHIILHGGEEHLSPERRLDQTIYFAYKAEE